MTYRWLVRALPRTLTTLLVAGLLASCGNLTMGGFGDASVAVSGNAPDGTTTSLATAPVGRVGSVQAVAGSSDDDDPEGEIEVRFTLFLFSQSGVPTQLGEELEVRVDLRGLAEGDVVERQRIEAVRYTELRVVFLDIEVEVDAGLIIDGQPVTGPIDVDFDDLTLVVSKAIDLDVQDGESVELVLDLNAPAWLQAVDPATSRVDASVFADRLSVVTR